MTNGEFLDTSELHLLTGTARSAGQAGWLKEHAIPHNHENKRVIVSRLHVRAWLEGRSVQVSKGPNWSAMNRA